MNYLIFGFGLLVGFCIGLLVISLLCVADSPEADYYLDSKSDSNNGPN